MHNAPAALHLVEAGTYHSSRGKDYPRHAHPFWEVLYFLEGTVEVAMPAARQTIEPGAVLVIPPHTRHAETARTAYRDIYIQVTADRDLGWPPFSYDDPEHALRDICAALAREWGGRAPAREEMLALLLRQLDIQLRRSHGRQRIPSAERVVYRAENLLETLADRPLRIGDLARQVGVSVSALRTHFAEVRGCCPLACLHRIRAQRSANLLKTTDMKIEAVAAHCGYHSASHLSRHIRRAYGRTPGELRGHAGVPRDSRLRS